MPRTCANPACGAELAVDRRAQIRTCSTRCRVALHRAEQRTTSDLPTELRERDRWIRHTADKVPLRATNGRPASSTAPTTWSDFDTARRSKVGAGVGFVLNGDGIICLDLDHCIVDGQLASWAQQILDRCPPTYVETSMSGTGLHIWGHGRIGTARIIRHDQVAIEAYGWGRYIALGRRYQRAPLSLATLDALLATL